MAKERLEKEKAEREAILVTAFGAEKWRKYYGEVGAAPSVPDHLFRLYTQDCKLWPGKKVYDTHLLTLIPATVGGKPLTLDSFAELIQKPQNGGHGTKYRYYSDEVKKELGAKPAGASHWALMTRDLIEGSKSKSYDDQRKLVAQQAQKFNIPYTLTPILDGVASVVCHHAETGVKLFPNVYSRTSERLKQQGLGGCFGRFGADGLSVPRDFANPQAIRGVAVFLF
jgi:hypothetical protein